MSRQPSRRSLLSTVAGSVALTAGCLSGAVGSDDATPTNGSTTETTETTTSRTTTTTTTTAVPAWRRCDQAVTPQTPTVTTTVDDAPTPKSYPDRPVQRSGDSLREFVKATERAYTHNRILRREGAAELGYIDVKFVSVANVEQTDDGAVVDVTVEFGYSTGDPGETAGTHADGAQRVSYFVGERVVRRVEKPRAEYPDPRTTDGTVLWCTPSSE